MKKQLIAVIGAIVSMAITHAQQISVPVAKSTVALPFDTRAMTNIAALTSLAINNVDNIVVEIYDEANADIDSTHSEPERIVIPYGKDVKSMITMRDVVNNQLAHFTVIDPNKPVYIEVKFCKGDVTYRYGDYGTNPDFQVLLYASGGGYLTPGKGGTYTLTQSLNVRLNHTIRFNIPGIVAGKSIRKYGDSLYSEPLRYLNSNTGDFSMSVGAIETGGYFVAQGHFDGHFQNIALSLVDGEEVELSDALVQVLLVNSEHVKMCTDPAGVNLVIDSYNGRLINPLLNVKLSNICPQGYVCSPINYSVKLQTTEGILPRGYWLLDNTTKVESYYSGSAVLFRINPDTDYHIIPDLPVIQTSGNSGGGIGVVDGGKG